MKRLLLLGLVCFVGYYIYTEKHRDLLEAFRSDMPTDFPPEFRGKYVADVEANLRYIRNNNSFSQRLKEGLSDLMVAERLKIQRSSMIGTDPAGKNPERVEVRVRESGRNWVVIQSVDSDPDGRAIRSRIDRDATGIWFSSDTPIIGFRQRFKKVD